MGRIYAKKHNSSSWVSLTGGMFCINPPWVTEGNYGTFMQKSPQSYGHKTGSGSLHLRVSVPVPVSVPMFQLPVVGRLRYLFQPLITNTYCAHRKMVILSWNIAHGCPKFLEWSICLKLKMKNLTMIRNHFILEVVPAVGVIVIVFGIYITLLFVIGCMSSYECCSRILKRCFYPMGSSSVSCCLKITRKNQPEPNSTHYTQLTHNHDPEANSCCKCFCALRYSWWEFWVTTIFRNAVTKREKSDSSEAVLMPDYLLMMWIEKC